MAAANKQDNAVLAYASIVVTGVLDIDDNLERSNLATRIGIDLSGWVSGRVTSAELDKSAGAWAAEFEGRTS
jgi:hypothetical protein